MKQYTTSADEVAKLIAVPLKEWAGNCEPICEKLLAAGLIGPEENPRIVHGAWIGPIAPHTMYDGREAVMHTWIECDGEDGVYVVDPTRSIFEGTDHEIHVGHKLPTEYRSDEDEVALMVAQINEFLAAYKTFRKTRAMPEYPPSALEIVNGFADRLGELLGW